jgi:Ca-activated chloride channel family protein
VTVTDSAGQYAHGLASKHFSIIEDGITQKIDSFSAEEAPFAATILVDMSGSMEYRFGLVRGAAATFIESIREDDQVALFGFNDKVRLFQDFTNTRYITDYIWDAEARDSTRLYDCMNEAIDALAKRPEKRRVIVMISDGWDTDSQKATMDSVIKKSHAAGVTVYSVDLIDDKMLRGAEKFSASLRRGRSEMREFANQTGGRYVSAPDGNNLEACFTGIVDELRNQYTLTYYSTNDKRDGRWRKLSVTLSKSDLTARTRRGYFAPKK